MVPQSEALVLWQLTDQVTLVAGTPFTVPVKVCCAPDGSVACVGLTRIGEVGATTVGCSVTTALADLVVSA
jgi:hypothetical protein